MAGRLKISHTQAEQVAKLFAAQLRTKPADKSAGANTVRRPDKVELSQESREVQSANKAMAETPDVRSEVLARIKAQLATGEYRVSGREVAKKMLARSLADRLR